MEIGIDKISLYPTTGALWMEDLCRARGKDPESVLGELMVDQRAINPPWEDPVTMAVNAAKPLLDDDDRQRIELVLVGTETPVDLEKPIASWVHGLLGIQSGCRTLEIKHACYSGTACLQLAAAWLASGLSPEGKALVVTTDQSLPAMGKPWEYVMGAGAAAAVVSRQPRVAELELGHSGTYATDVTDVIRPTGRIETGNNQESLYSYLDALHEAYAAYAERVVPSSFEDHFAANLYHMPFGGMAWRADRSLFQDQTGRNGEAARDHFRHKTEPSLRFNRRVGSVYGGSLLFALAGLVAGRDDLTPGDRVGIYSYGSGCCAEYYSVRIGPGARDGIDIAGIEDHFDSRRRVTVDEYERVERERDEAVGIRDYRPDPAALDGWWDGHYAGRGLLVLDHIDDYVRRYRWS